jgi:hypothetical protein
LFGTFIYFQKKIGQKLLYSSVLLLGTGELIIIIDGYFKNYNYAGGSVRILEEIQGSVKKIAVIP